MAPTADLDALTGGTVELLQTLIRNACVNDGSPDSGQEVRNADVLETVLAGAGLAVQRYEPTPGRVSLVARIEGSDPGAASLCLMGHTDVVPVNPDGWSRDPFGGELVDGEVWGRGAVDMLNLTASMAVAVRHLADAGFRPRGDLVYVAVADEESGSAHGARWLADNAAVDIACDYVLTENGGLHSGPPQSPVVGISVGEKGVAWRRLRVRGTPGHGSMPFRSDNALVRAAAVVHRLAEYRPAPRFTELWTERVRTLGLDDELQAALLDPSRIDDVLAQLPNAGAAAHLHACTHTTFSANVMSGAMKTNVIPDAIELEVDIRTLPGEDAAAVQAHLDAALGDLAPVVEVEVLMDDPATISPTDTPLWDSLQRAVGRPFPSSRVSPQLVVGFTDARIFRSLGSVAYGAGLFSPSLDAGDFARRFHGNDERIDVESLGLTARLWVDVCRDLLA
jgi:acetylornithine deacetylase/succinyl-diaminopimelate desuccinylase-like protein